MYMHSSSHLKFATTMILVKLKRAKTEKSTKTESPEVAPRRFSVTEAFAFVDDEDATSDRKLAHDRNTTDQPPPAPANPFAAFASCSSVAAGTSKDSHASKKKAAISDSKFMDYDL